eukprot:2460520-Amphidinium_carterae.2
MMQGNKPRFEIKIANNPANENPMDDMDVRLLAYKTLQGHFSKVLRPGECATRSNPDKISTVIKIKPEVPGTVLESD